MKYIVLFITSLFILDTATSNPIDKEYYRSEMRLSDTALQKNDTLTSLIHLTNIIREFEASPKLYVQDNDICNFTFDAYYGLFLWEHNTLESKLKYVNKISYIIKNNNIWAQKYIYKNSIKDLYINTIYKLIANEQFTLASKYINEMIWFAEKYYKSNLNDILLTSCLMFRNINSFDEAEKICNRLYSLFETLDNVQKYDLISYMVHHSFIQGNYKKVIDLASKNENIIRESNEYNKQDLIFFVCFSINKMAESYQCKTYSSTVDSLYITSYEWSKRFDSPYIPIAIINRAYYNYLFKTKVRIAIKLFYQYLDYCENGFNLNSNTYLRIEDIQNAVISILLNDIIKADVPSNLDELMEKYNKVFSYLIVNKRGELHRDFIESLNMAKEICYENKN